MRSKYLSLTAVALVAACTPAAKPVDPAVYTAASDAEIASYQKAYAAHDAAGVAAMFADDGVLMDADTTSSVGKAAIQKSFETQFASPMIPGNTVAGNVIASGPDFFVSEGTVDVTIPAMGKSAAMTVKGKWMSLSKRQADSTWKMERLIWNNNTAWRPAVPAAPKEAAKPAAKPAAKAPAKTPAKAPAKKAGSGGE